MAEDTPSPPAANSAKSSSRVDELVDRGLELYGAGELHSAMNEWEHALSIAPDSERAREYLAYVRDNFALLESKFAAAAEIARVSAELDVPFGLETVDDEYGQGGDDGDFYDLVELETESDAKPEAKIGVERYIESVDEGWFLDEMPDTGRADALPPPPAESAAELAEELEAVSAGLMDAVGDSEDGDDTGDVFELEADLPPDDAESYEIAPLDSAAPAVQPEVEAPSPREVTLDLEFEPGVGPSVDLEAAPPSVPSLDLNDIELAPSNAPSPVDGDGDSDYDDELTVERGAAGQLPDHIDAALADEEVTVPGGEELSFADNLSLSHDALAAIRPGTADGVAVEEQTIERPGIVKRGFALGNLDELDGAMPRDDRVLDGDESPEVKVAFRNKDDELDEEMTIERPAVADRAGGLDERPAAVNLAALDDEFTVERRLNPAVIVDQSLLAEDLETIDRRLADDETRASAEFASGQETRELRRGESPDVGDQVVADALAELDREEPAGESEEDRIRRRIGFLVKAAGGHAAHGRTKVALALLDRALDEAPDTATAQKAIHSHLDLILEIYELFLGRMDAVPVVAVPMQELGTNELDNRAVFLLSRIDGTITFEEVLDVSGMPRLESFRYLCRMLVKGILEIR